MSNEAMFFKLIKTLGQVFNLVEYYNIRLSQVFNLVEHNFNLAEHHSIHLIWVFNMGGVHFVGANVVVVALRSCFMVARMLWLLRCVLVLVASVSTE